MKDFDAEAAPPTPEEDRTFRIGGRQFVARPLVPLELWAHWWDAWAKRAEISNVDYLAACDTAVEGALEPRYVEEWHALRADPERPLAPGELEQVLVFLWETQTGRPTQRADSSSSGPEQNGTSSTEKQPEPVSTSPA